MKNIWNWIKNNPNRAMFLVPILLVAGISISHVVTWYDMANPISWAIYLSIAIEVGAMSALVAATNKIKGGVWFMFGLVTFIQMIGNIFYSYVQIDATGELFRNWVELTGPVWEMMGTDLTDIIGLKRWLAFLEGGFLPLISLTSLHFFVNYEKEKEDEVVDDEFDEDHALDMVTNNMVEELMEEEGHETVGDLIESLDHTPEDDVDVPIRVSEEESITEEVVNEIEENSINKELEEDKAKVIDLPKETQIEVIETPPVKEVTQEILSKQDRVVNNPPPKRKAGIDRIT
tara:strand:+ start:4674 stop:5540 length:867 start_codon:yes stop_codon:yes gene_type:complete